MNKFLTLNGLLDTLLEYKEHYGGNIPVLLADGDSPNAMATVSGVFVVDLYNDDETESQTTILITNLVQEKLIEKSGWNLE